MKNIYPFLLVTLMILLSSCAAKKPYYKNDALRNASLQQNVIPESKIDYELFLVGDIDAESSDINRSDIVSLIKSQLRPNSKNQSVVFLGNSIGRDGLPDEESADFSETDRAIEDCLKQLKENTDKVYFIPGNHEWFDGRDYTVDAVQNVEEYFESKVGDKNIFAPSKGCGEPKVVKLTDNLLLVLIDSQWVLQGDDSEERKRSGCDIDNELALVTFIQQILAKNKNKNVILAAHHPIYTNGKTGGNYGARSHLLPLPVLGSIISGIRKISSGPQQFGHPQYEAYRAAINLALSNFEGVISVAAHDHNMQYIPKNDNHFVVAGSGNNVDFVSKGGDAEFAAMKKGFARIIHTTDLELWLEFFVADPKDKSKAVSIFRKRLYKKEIIDYSDTTVYKDLAAYPRTYRTAASETYKDSKFGMGKAYRTEWGTEVSAPVLLLEEFAGGLKPVQQGGGFQTKSIRLENAEGRQWVLRTIDKDVTKVVPQALRGTFFQNLVQDGIAAAHPYAAFAIPQLAEAAKIYHANPTFVWLPKQKALGDYNKDFAEKLYLFEERPGGNMEGHPSYGGAKKSVNTPDLIRKLLKNSNHVVDQEYVLRARLFDILIGDWDRHDDQWRWGIYEDPKFPGKKIYRSIPRDRDQAFFKNDGFINYIASRPFFGPQLRKFDHEVDNISGLSFNARHFDRHFLSQLNKESYLRIADELKKDITDEVIRSAFHSWPKKIFDISGEEIITKLKSRRAKLDEYAAQFYEYLTKEVTVIGTNGKNVFDIVAMPGDMLDVKAYHIDDDKKELIWSRVIDGKDCEELRLFGLKKKDEFNFSGNHKSSIKVRLVGGSGGDIVHNQSSSIHIIAYDREDGMTLKGNNIKSKLRDHKGINRFDRLDWKLDRSFHFPMITFYTDEGVGLSYNFWWKKNGFRKNPYKSNHTLSLGYFWANSAIVSNYSGHWPDALGPDWDFRLNASAKGPTFTQYFYGLGNEFIDFEERFPGEPEAGSTSFHIVKGTHIYVNPNFERDFGNNRHFSLNTSVEYINMQDEPDETESRFIFLEEANRTARDFESKFYAGFGIRYTSDRVNNKVIPTSGYIFDIGADFRQSLSDSDYSNFTFSSDIIAYIPFSPTHKVVLASNIGGAYTLGDTEFFHANYLSNQSRLRGYKTNRFGGEAIVYHATDLRIRLLEGNGRLKTGLGIFGSFDYGRAFLDGEDNDDWHTSFGGGIYLTPINLLGFKIGYYIGEGDAQMTIGGALSF